MEIKNADELLETLESLTNEEKQKFLDEIFYLYFNKKNLPRTEIDWANED